MKRNTLTLIVSLALVAVLSVGATLAYISASDGAVTNTFSFGSIEVSASEDEPTAVADEVITPNQKGYDYANVVPGQDLNKTPKFAITSSVDAYVFVRVSGFGTESNIICDTFNTEWTAMDDVDEFGNGTYYKTVTGSDDSQDLGAIFDGVTVGTNETAEIGNVVIKVAAIQKTGLATAAAALAEVTFQG